jgi:hypothetical protein
MDCIRKAEECPEHHTHNFRTPSERFRPLLAPDANVTQRYTVDGDQHAVGDGDDFGV